MILYTAPSVGSLHCDRGATGSRISQDASNSLMQAHWIRNDCVHLRILALCDAGVVWAVDCLLVFQKVDCYGSYADEGIRPHHSEERSISFTNP